MRVEQLVEEVEREYQIRTNSSGKRPFGVGMLIVGLNDQNTPQIYQITPNGNCLEFEAMAMGNKSQSARTYLENYLQDF